MTQPTPCSQPNPCEDGELCGTHEVEQAHAEGEHAFCGPTCEVEFPSDMLRNTILCRAIPGAAGMLDELLRRAAARPDPAAEAHPTGQRWRVEIHDGGSWMPAGTPTQHKQIALDALAARRSVAKTWAADGQPVRYRVVRETTTYTVEDES